LISDFSIAFRDYSVIFMTALWSLRLYLTTKDAKRRTKSAELHYKPFKVATVLTMAIYQKTEKASPVIQEGLIFKN